MKASRTYVARAVAYAAERWFLDDEVMVREWCDRSHTHHARPEELVDAYAEKYDLHDFNDGVPLIVRTRAERLRRESLTLANSKGVPRGR